MMNRNKIFTLLVALTILVFAVGSAQAKDISPPEVSSVSHQPGQIEYQTNVTVIVEFLDDSTVNNITMQYCALEPDNICHFPLIELIRTGNDTWSGSFEVLESTGVIGYKLTIGHDTGTMTAPDSANYLGYDNIGLYASFYYFTINLTQPSSNTPTASAPLNVSLFDVTLAISGIFVLRVILKDRKKTRI